MTNKPLKSFTILLITISFFTILLTSCKKDNTPIDYNENLVAAENNVIGEKIYLSVFNLLFKASRDTSLLNNGFAFIDSAGVSYTSTPTPKFTVSYGDYYILCPDKLKRNGEYTAELTGDFNDQNTVATVTFQDHHVQEYKVEGLETISNLGPNSLGQLTFQYKVDTGLISLHDSSNSLLITWECTKIISWVYGAQTPYEISDDIFSIYGTSAGTSQNGIAFNTIVTDSLQNFLKCNWVSGGKQSIGTPGLEVNSGIIDYIEADSCSKRVDFYFGGNYFYENVL